MVRFRIAMIVAVALLGWPLAAPVGAQPEVEVRTVPVAPGIFMLMGEGGNLGVSHGPDGVLVIDDQYARMSQKILAAVDALGDSPLRYVLNTHWHGDHTGGNANMNAAGATIVAHDNVRVRMSKDHFNPAFGRTTPASPAEALPVITFDSDLSFHFNGQTIRAEHVNPAHTDGDAVVYFAPANVVHTGDIFFNGFYPFIDQSSGGDVRGMLAAIDSVLARVDDETKIIPGHGALSNRQELKTYRAMLATLSERVADAIEDGKTVEEVLAMKPTADHDAQWGGGFLKPEQFVRILYGLLSK